MNARGQGHFRAVYPLNQWHQHLHEYCVKHLCYLFGPSIRWVFTEPMVLWLLLSSLSHINGTYLSFHFWQCNTHYFEGTVYKIVLSIESLSGKIVFLRVTPDFYQILPLINLQIKSIVGSLYSINLCILGLKIIFQFSNFTKCFRLIVKAPLAFWKLLILTSCSHLIL